MRWKKGRVELNLPMAGYCPVRGEDVVIRGKRLLMFRLMVTAARGKLMSTSGRHLQILELL